MALISVLAQPGLAFMESANAARENRLAMAAAEAEQATARAQQEMRQRAFQALGTEGGNPQAAIGALAAAGDFEGARLANTMITAQQRAAAQAAEQERRVRSDESAIFTNAAQSGVQDLAPLRNRLSRINSPLADASDAELQSTYQAYSATTPPPNAQRFTAENPATGQEEIAFFNPRTQEVTFSGIRAGTGDIGRLAGAVSSMAGAIAAGATPEGTGARDRAVQGVSDAIESVGTTLRTAQTIAQGNPGAFGQRGNIARDTGAVVEQLFGPGAANAAAQFVSGGAGLDELARIRAATQIQVAQSIPDFTGEESGRITEAERAITEQAVGATNALSSQSGAMEALAYVYPLQLSRVNRQRLLSRGRLEYAFIKPNGEVDLDVLDRHLGAPMRQAGFTDEQIQRAARDTIAITRQQAALLATGAFVNE